jgi:hypothetical protein
MLKVNGVLLEVYSKDSSSQYEETFVSGKTTLAELLEKFDNNGRDSILTVMCEQYFKNLDTPNMEFGWEILEEN